MLSRRDFLQVTAAAAALSAAPGGLARAAGKQAIGQDELLAFEPLGQVTLLNFTDCHAQIVPIHFREPSLNLGFGANRGLPPHITGKQMLAHFGLRPGSPEAYAFSSHDFVALARDYGRVGGLDRLTTLVKAIRAERPGKTLLLDGGDTWQGSLTALESRGGDMVRLANALGVEAMTAHWEFTYGAERVMELKDKLDFPFLAGNVKELDWDDDVFEHTATYQRGGLEIAVIGQAFPYTPIANPRYLIPEWSFGIEEERLQERVTAAREGGADLVVVLSHNGFDVDRKLAGRVAGIDVLLTGHTHDAIPAAVEVGRTLLVAAGSHGKFLARLDLDVQHKKVRAYRFKLIPVLADAISPDAEMAALVAEQRAPHKARLDRVLGRTSTTLYRRGNLAGTFDDLICQALMAERDAEIALSPGFRWGATLLPGDDITFEAVTNQTAITYANAYRTEMTGSFLKEVLEDVADNIFNADPYQQQGGDMVRTGGLGFTIDLGRRIRYRISGLTLLRSGQPIEAGKTYVVSGWASVNEGTEGPAIYDVVSSYVEHKKLIRMDPKPHIRVVGL
jgi:sulfur-oxidizing protein SoxB